MEINIDWQSPLLLSRHKRLVIDRESLDMVEDVPGVYYFSRRFGSKWEPFYIGETLTLRSRLRQHLDHTQMFCLLTGIPRRGLAEIAMGARYFHFGYLKGKQSRAKACLKVVQKFMIEEALAQ